MSAYAPDRLAELRKMVEAHFADYLASGGARGHVMESFVDPGQWITMLLMRTLGRKSGELRTTPLGYWTYNGEFIVVATKGGADSHPAWYLNMQANGEVAFQIGPEAFTADWREARPEERGPLWAYLDTNSPVFPSYRAATAREIPIICMKPRKRIAVFTA